MGKGVVIWIENLNTLGTVERHRKTEVVSNGDQNLHTFFAFSPVHSHPFPISCSKAIAESAKW